MDAHAAEAAMDMCIELSSPNPKVASPSRKTVYLIAFPTELLAGICGHLADEDAFASIAGLCETARRFHHDLIGTLYRLDMRRNARSLWYGLWKEDMALIERALSVSPRLDFAWQLSGFAIPCSRSTQWGDLISEKTDVTVIPANDAVNIPPRCVVWPLSLAVSTGNVQFAERIIDCHVSVDHPGLPPCNTCVPVNPWYHTAFDLATCFQDHQTWPPYGREMALMLMRRIPAQDMSQMMKYLEYCGRADDVSLALEIINRYPQLSAAMGCHKSWDVAIELGNWEFVELALSYGADLNMFRGGRGNLVGTVMSTIVRRERGAGGVLPRIRWMMGKGLSLGFTDSAGNTLLHQMDHWSLGSFEEARELGQLVLEAVSVDRRNITRVTPLCNMVFFIQVGIC